MKKSILAENVAFIYSNDFEESFPKDKYLITSDAAEFVKKEELEPVCRISLTVDNKVTHKTYVDYLYWFDNTVLEELDLKVESGVFSDADFENSIKTQFVEKLFCQGCKSVFRGGLAIDGGSFYIGAWQLFWEKLLRLRKSNKLKKCPNCSEHLRIAVVHVFR
jgi:hypothetical protein